MNAAYAYVLTGVNPAVTGVRGCHIQALGGPMTLRRNIGMASTLAVGMAMPDPVTTTRVVEDTKFRVMFTKDLLIFMPLNRTEATVQPEMDQLPAGFAFRFPK